jgi:hypothetical protein
MNTVLVVNLKWSGRHPDLLEIIFQTFVGRE